MTRRGRATIPHAALDQRVRVPGHVPVPLPALPESESLVYTRRMKTIARTALLWVMVFAMPAQGIAATLMMFCGPSHERMMSGTGHGHHAQAHGGGQDHAAVSHDSAHHAPAGEAHGATPADDGRSLADLAMFSCSACAACCSVMGMPANLSLPRQAESKHVVSDPLSVGARSHLPDGPDRPPRAILA